MIQEQDLYYLRGSQGSPVTLTAAYVASSPVLARLKKTLLFEGQYTPAVADSVLHILVEFSNDPIDSVPSAITHWRPLVTQIAGTTEVDLYVDGGTGMGSRAGIPIIVPGDKTSSVGVAIPWTWEWVGDLSCNWVRASFKEVSSGAFGTTDAEVSMSR